MDTRPLGSIGLVVSRLGLGLAALGRPGYINIGHAADIGSDRAIATMEMRAHAVLDAAWAAGIRYFDVARSYGRAEAFLASWLASRKIPPGPITVRKEHPITKGISEFKHGRDERRPSAKAASSTTPSATTSKPCKAPASRRS